MLLITRAHAVIHPRAMVVHPYDASAAESTVVCPGARVAANIILSCGCCGEHMLNDCCRGLDRPQKTNVMGHHVHEYWNVLLLQLQPSQAVGGAGIRWRRNYGTREGTEQDCRDASRRTGPSSTRRTDSRHASPSAQLPQRVSSMPWSYVHPSA